MMDSSRPHITYLIISAVLHLAKTLKGWFCALVIAGIILAGGKNTDALMEGQEYQIKAAFIYNFLRFVQWPSQSLAGPGGALTFCIIGEDPFGKYITLFDGKPVGDRKVVVRHITLVQDIRGCSALFIPESGTGNTNQILETSKNMSILTIGDAEGLVSKGIIISFFIEGDKVRFEMNPNAAKRAGLSVDYRLLKLARIAGN